MNHFILKFNRNLISASSQKDNKINKTFNPWNIKQFNFATFQTYTLYLYLLYIKHIISSSIQQATWNIHISQWIWPTVYILATISRYCSIPEPKFRLLTSWKISGLPGAKIKESLASIAFVISGQTEFTKKS